MIGSSTPIRSAPRRRNEQAASRSGRARYPAGLSRLHDMESALIIHNRTGRYGQLDQFLYPIPRLFW